MLNLKKVILLIVLGLGLFTFSGCCSLFCWFAPVKHPGAAPSSTATPDSSK